MQTCLHFTVRSCTRLQPYFTAREGSTYRRVYILLYVAEHVYNRILRHVRAARTDVSTFYCT